MKTPPKPPTYQRDSYRRQLKTEVVDGHAGERPWVVLADTILYPEGGGQPADRGWIDRHEVVDVQRAGAALRHYLRTPLQPGPVEVALDWERRFDHMQQHTAQHLITALAADRFGWQTTSFHLGAERSDIELEVSDPAPERIAELEEAVAEAVRAGHRVYARFVTPEDYAGLPVRSRGLPEGHEGDIRLVEIEGIDLNTCGGTHVSSTAQLEGVKLLGQEAIRGGTRLFYVAGARVRRRLQDHEVRNAVLRSLLGTGDDEFVDSVERRLEELREASRRIRSLQNELGEAYASLLAGHPDEILVEHFRGHEIAFLQMLGRRVSELRSDALIFLTSEQDGKRGVFVLVRGENCPTDISTVGRQAAEILQGKGGGSGQMFQGKAENLSGRADVENLLRQRQ